MLVALSLLAILGIVEFRTERPGKGIVVSVVLEVLLAAGFAAVVGSLAMARNVEIKARISSVESLLPKAAALASEGPVVIEQDDTFFRCESGRLKLRDFLDGSGELIFYRRDNRSGPKESFYLRSATSAPDVLRESLSLAYGQSGRVVKQRTLFLIGRTRVHLDRVQGLGHFLELEVVLGEDEPSEAGVREAHELMGRLGIAPQQLIEGAYVDLSGREGI